ncbi:MAG: hypothetical protein J2P45_03915 [Candidatus Dormibacteraeota bacterium]|nr:hypothetical protein [Candidatus Dormibacteraeota bacterium]
MSAGGPGDWDEVFAGPCLEARVIQAVLEAKGFRAITDGLAAEPLFTGLAFERCRVLVPSYESDRARQAVVERGQEGPTEDGSQAP